MPATIYSLAPELIRRIIELGSESGEATFLCTASLVHRSWTCDAQGLLWRDLIIEKKGQGAQLVNSPAISRRYQTKSLVFCEGRASPHGYYQTDKGVRETLLNVPGLEELEFRGVDGLIVGMLCFPNLAGEDTNPFSLHCTVTSSADADNCSSLLASRSHISSNLRNFYSQPTSTLAHHYSITLYLSPASRINEMSIPPSCPLLLLLQLIVNESHLFRRLRVPSRSFSSPNGWSTSYSRCQSVRWFSTRYSGTPGHSLLLICIFCQPLHTHFTRHDFRYY